MAGGKGVAWIQTDSAGLGGALKSELIGNLDSVGRVESRCLCFVIVGVHSGHWERTQSAELHEGPHTVY